MKKFDVIVVGELNIDLIMNQIVSFPMIGKETLANQMTLTLGSSSAIFACNLSSLGAKVAFIGKIGKDIFGDSILQALEVKGVDTSLIIQCGELKTGATLVLNFGEDRAMITHPGAMAQMRLSDIPLEKLAEAQHLHYSSYFLQPALQGDIAGLFQEAKNAGLTTSFDTQWDPSEKWNLDFNSILPFVDVFLPNEKELLKLTGTDTLETAIDIIKDKSNALVVKMGNKGSISVHKGKTLHKPPFLNKRVVDAIGAGDSFNAGFIFKYFQNAPIEVCQEFGNLIGAISTTAPGGTSAFTTPKQIMKIAKNKFGYAEHGVKE
jgi:sugar/nucleoside kinase (ribokinase family)